MTRTLIRTKRAIQALRAGTPVYREIPTTGLLMTHQKLYRVTHIHTLSRPTPDLPPAYEVTFADKNRSPQIANQQTVFVVELPKDTP